MEYNEFKKFIDRYGTLKRMRRNAPVFGGTGIIAEKNATGVTLHDDGNGWRGGYHYFGLFKVSAVRFAGRTDFLIRNGSPELAPPDQIDTPAGFAVINDKYIEVPAQYVPINAARGVVSASFALSATNEPVFNGYGSSELMPVNGKEIIYFLLATFFRKGKKVTVLQQQSGSIYGWIFKECYEVKP